MKPPNRLPFEARPPEATAVEAPPSPEAIDRGFLKGFGGFGFRGLGFRDSFRVWDVGFRVQSLGSGIPQEFFLGFKVDGLGFL